MKARFIITLSAAAICVACSPVRKEPQNIPEAMPAAPQEKPVAADLPKSFVVFGDHGYHFEWPSKSDLRDKPQSAEDWYKLHLHPDLYAAGLQQPERLPAIELSPVTGGYVLSTGLYRVSEAMYEACVPGSCRFGVMLGDNVYPDGGDGVDDARRFEEILSKPLARIAHGQEDFHIYSVLGNHDWHISREGARAQLDFLESTPPFYMDGYFYRVVPPGLEGEVEIFAIDTEVMLAGTDVYKRKESDGFWEIDKDLPVTPRESAVPRTEAERTMVEWLESALAESQARWKIVIGHHPFWSTAGGKFAQSVALRSLILPTLCRHADAYLSGHEHTMEFHQYDCSSLGPEVPEEPFYQVVSGAAGKQRMTNIPFMKKQDELDDSLQTLFARGGTWGYAMATVDDDKLKFDLYTIGMDGIPHKAFSHTIMNRID